MVVSPDVRGAAGPRMVSLAGHNLRWFNVTFVHATTPILPPRQVLLHDLRRKEISTTLMQPSRPAKGAIQSVSSTHLSKGSKHNYVFYEEQESTDLENYGTTEKTINS